MSSEQKAAELPRQDDAFQAAVDEHVAANLKLIDDLAEGYEIEGLDYHLLQLEFERQAWDLLATYQAVRDEQIDQPEHNAAEPQA